jgi:hypothetical protein
MHDSVIIEKHVPGIPINNWKQKNYPCFISIQFGRIQRFNGYTYNINNPKRIVYKYMPNCAKIIRSYK